MSDVDVPDGWREEDLGSVKLYLRRVDEGYLVPELVYHSEYFGGDDRHRVIWLLGNGENKVLFQDLDDRQGALDTVEDAMHRSPGQVHMEQELSQ